MYLQTVISILRKWAESGSRIPWYGHVTDPETLVKIKNYKIRRWISDCFCKNAAFVNPRIQSRIWIQDLDQNLFGNAGSGSVYNEWGSATLLFPLSSTTCTCIAWPHPTPPPPCKSKEQNNHSLATEQSCTRNVFKYSQLAFILRRNLLRIRTRTVTSYTFNLEREENEE